MRSDSPVLCPKCDCTAFTMPKYIPAYEPLGSVAGKLLWKPEHFLFTCITCGFKIETRCEDATDEQWKIYEELHPHE